ncbi:conserved hypothetical protein [Methanocella paludicola SANAE]|uniref:Uncharacterized protein n=1 Tax=Methanocella paludicola (strain DSM 17711 / JCM 13418 / NBRC 101707 / SANAE) TaxID=304371 RepID=D1YZ90_METPS|nr:conserved hypothetical protein [Methanocella paludicola SANAE]
MKKALFAIMALSAILIVAAAIFVPASAQLTSTSFGFPVIVQSSDTVAFQQYTADALDYEDVSIDFPVAGCGLPFGAVSLAFPSIHQTSLQTQSITQTSFAQTSEFAEFAYPFVGVGSLGLPGFCF